MEQTKTKTKTKSGKGKGKDPAEKKKPTIFRGEIAGDESTKISNPLVAWYYRSFLDDIFQQAKLFGIDPDTLPEKYQRIYDITQKIEDSIKFVDMVRNIKDLDKFSFKTARQRDAAKSALKNIQKLKDMNLSNEEIDEYANYSSKIAEFNQLWDASKLKGNSKKGKFNLPDAIYDPKVEYYAELANSKDIDKLNLAVDSLQSLMNLSDRDYLRHFGVNPDDYIEPEIPEQLPLGIQQEIPKEEKKQVPIFGADIESDLLNVKLPPLPDVPQPPRRRINMELFPPVDSLRVLKPEEIEIPQPRPPNPMERFNNVQLNIPAAYVDRMGHKSGGVASAGMATFAIAPVSTRTKFIR